MSLTFLFLITHERKVGSGWELHHWNCLVIPILTDPWPQFDLRWPLMMFNFFSHFWAHFWMSKVPSDQKGHLVDPCTTFACGVIWRTVIILIKVLNLEKIGKKIKVGQFVIYCRAGCAKLREPFLALIGLMVLYLWGALVTFCYIFSNTFLCIHLITK